MWLPPGPASVIVRPRASLHRIDCAAVPSAKIALLARNYRHRTKKKKKADVAPLLANKLFVSTVCTLKYIFHASRLHSRNYLHINTEYISQGAVYVSSPVHCAPLQAQPYVSISCGTLSENSDTDCAAVCGIFFTT